MPRPVLTCWVPVQLSINLVAWYNLFVVFSCLYRLTGAQVNVSWDLHTSVDGARISKMLHSHVWFLGRDSWKMDSAGLLMAGSLPLTIQSPVSPFFIWPAHMVSPAGSWMSYTVPRDFQSTKAKASMLSGDLSSELAQLSLRPCCVKLNRTASLRLEWEGTS